MKAYPLLVSCSVLALPLSAQLILVPESNNTVTIDGVIGASEWSDTSSSASIANLVAGSIFGPADLTADVSLKWDSTNLYLLFQVTDNTRQVDSSENDPLSINSWNDDSVEVYLDMQHTGTGALDTAAGRYQYRFSLEHGEIETFPAGSHPTTDFVFAHTGATAYVMEIEMPWTTLGFVTPTIGTTIGFEAGINDDDDGGDRDAQFFWNAVDGTAWNDASQWGDIELAAAIPEPSTVSLLFGIFSLTGWLIVRRNMRLKSRQSVRLAP